MRWTVLLGFLLVYGQALELRAPPELAAKPGDYVTAIFRARGEGRYRLKASLPPGWQALLLPASVSLHGTRVLVLTARVPELAPAGRRERLALTLVGKEERAEATTHVTVARRARLALRAAGAGEARIGRPAEYLVTVQNLGNAPEPVRLAAESNLGEAWVEPAALVLAPGEKAQVRLTVRLPKEVFVSPGYRMVTWVRARGRAEPAKAEVRVVTTWKDRLAGGGKSKEPRLRLDLAGRVGLGTSIRAGTPSGLSLSYRLAPSLKGELSDFVAAEVTPNALEGDLQSPFAQPPNGGALRLAGSGWDAGLRVDPWSAGFEGGFGLGAWRVRLEGNARYDLRQAGIGFSTASTAEDVNLQFGGNLSYEPAGPRGRAQLEYVRPLGGGFRIRSGLRLAGFLGPEPAVLLGGHQGLAWANDALSALADLSATPQLGQYAFGLSLASRRLLPLGFRTYGNLELAPAGLAWKAGGSAFAAPWPRSSLELAVAAAIPAAGPPQFTLAPTLSYRPPAFAGLGARLRLGYVLGYSPGDPRPSQTAKAGVALRYRGASLEAAGHYRFGLGWGYGLDLAAGWRPTPKSELLGRFGLERGASPKLEARLGWRQYWGEGFFSTVFADHAEGEKNRDRLEAVLTQSRLFSDDLGLSLGYGLEDPDGLAKDEEPLVHRVRLSLVFRTGFTFDTPKPVVDAFGGRRVGVVAGRAFLDGNLNGRFDPGEKALAGLSVALGEARAKTDAEGRYRLQARPGAYAPHLANLPATLDLYRPVRLVVRENHRQTLDLPLARTAVVAVALYDDANHNGRKDEGEFGIPYAGIRFQGPSSRTVLTDLYGRALATGLLPGSYRVAPDPARLPPGYAATVALKIELVPGKNRGPLALGAARPPKAVRTTYQSGMLAVFALLPRPSAPPGAEVAVKALVTGKATGVWVELGGRRWPLAAAGPGRYQGRLRLPRSTPIGPLFLEVKAENGAALAGGRARLQVVRAPLYTLVPQKLEAKKPNPVVLTLRFRAKTVTLTGPGVAIPLESADGYRWTGVLTPKVPGPLRLVPLADGEALEAARLEVKGRPLSERKQP